jgi:outer membrane immunogenic protein
MRAARAMILAAVAAALLPPLAAAAAPAYDWSGLYVGALGGYALGTSVHSDAVIDANVTDAFPLKGGMYGGEVGINWQVASDWVAGVSADYVGADVNGQTDAGSSGAFGCGVLHECQTSIRSIGTIRARVGYVSGATLYFATAGYAYGSVSAQIPNPLYAGTSQQNGWTVGVGVEHAFGGHWTGRLDLLHVDLGRFVYYEPGDAQAAASATLVRAGFSYKFGAP